MFDVWSIVFLNDVKDVKQANKKDIPNPKARPKTKVSLDDCVPPNTENTIISIVLSN